MSGGEAIARARRGLRDAGIVGVLRGDDPERAAAAAERAIAAGLRSVEVTLTVPGACDLLARLARRHPGVLVGAGTVLDAAGAEAAFAAGARFLVGPNLAEPVLRRAAELGVLYVPGAMTPSEVRRAASLAAGMVKVFPVARLGGPAYVRDLLGPFPDLELMVTGGVAPAEVAAYRDAGAAVVGSGSLFAAPDEALRAAVAGR